MAGDTPQISQAFMTSNLYEPNVTGTGFSQVTATIVQAASPVKINLTPTVSKERPPDEEAEEEYMRVIQVFIADPDDRLPLDNRMLYADEKPRVTDLTDNELFFEIDPPIQVLLARHNEVRLATVDKEASVGMGRDVYLEEIRVRDLRMVVAQVADFS